ncbi:M23 family metallopeptidase [Stappia sp. F7233]|uniref:M23 family metallopeptidase n=1 Tax=Stappia albiluteola TaxID=2758565 RepID=A0A839AC87_9HYPH|nr:M23 family metallopeptidase [Stappia albiluteola]MBA5776735.1 M23 family metallopeptidase [Stappia albiluteola]
MITQTTSQRSYFLSRTALAVIIAAMAAGCSAGIERFEDPIYTGGTSNQKQILGTASSQPSFEDISAGPTSSKVRTGKVESVALPPPGQAPAVATGSISSQARSAAPVAAATTTRGWTTAGGTQITARGGDTLASLSRRYGVPEKALADANGLQAGAALKSGQSLIVPTYVYGGAPATASKPAASVSGSLPATAIETPAIAGIPQRKPAGTPVKVAAVQRNVSDAVSAGTPRFKDDVRKGAPTVVKTVAPAETPTATPARLVTGDAEPETAKESAKQAVASSDPDVGRFRWPVHGRIISDFGAKPGGSRNDGINLAVPEGSEVKAVEDGVVIYAGNELKGYGNLVLVRHNDGWVSAYAHNSKLNVSRGDTVRRGDTVSYSGNTGSVTQPQVHFELRKGNKPVDPLRYLAKLQ